MPFRKIKRKIQNLEFRRGYMVNLLVVVFCMLIGYLIAVVSDSSHDTFREIRQIQEAVGDAKDLESLKERVRKNPKIFSRLGSQFGIKETDDFESLKEQVISNPELLDKINSELQK